MEEIQARTAGDVGLDWAASIGTGPCSFLSSSRRCGLPCGPLCVASPPPPRPSLPRDEYLCDGGDRGIPAAAGPTGGVGGIEPRDTVVGFDMGLKGRTQNRESPDQRGLRLRAAVRRSPREHGSQPERRHPGDQVREAAREICTDRYPRGIETPGPEPGAELARARSRAAGQRGRLSPDEESNKSGLSGYSGAVLVANNQQPQAALVARNRQKPGQTKERLRLDGIKTSEGPVIHGDRRRGQPGRQGLGTARHDRP